MNGVFREEKKKKSNIEVEIQLRPFMWSCADFLHFRSLLKTQRGGGGGGGETAGSVRCSERRNLVVDQPSKSDLDI